MVKRTLGALSGKGSFRSLPWFDLISIRRFVAGMLYFELHT